jgi:hypothetical protein
MRKETVSVPYLPSFHSDHWLWRVRFPEDVQAKLAADLKGVAIACVQRHKDNVLFFQHFVNSLKIFGCDHPVANCKGQALVSEKAVGLRDMAGKVVNYVGPNALIVCHFDDGKTSTTFDSNIRPVGQPAPRSGIAVSAHSVLIFITC